MAVDMILKLDGIKGESKIAEHIDEIDVQSFSWGISNSSTGHVGGGSGSGKASFQDVSLTKFVDFATSNLLKFCSNGEPIKEGTLVVRKSGGQKPLDYLKVKMEHIFVTQVQAGGSLGQDQVGEMVTLNFKKVHVLYKVQNPDGSGGAELPYGWNIEAIEAI